MPRCVIVIMDMLAGHWANGHVVPDTGLPPPNVLTYVSASKLPTFAECISQGVYAYGWNNGICNTAYGQKYLASGTYDAEAKPSRDPYWTMVRGAEQETILQACKRSYPGGKVASFGSDAWMQTGWWKAPDCTKGWGSYFSDFLTAQEAMSWMLANPDWKMVLIYLAEYDKTGNCPVFLRGAEYTEDKHHSIMILDKYLWMIKTFLQEKQWWDDTYLFVGSDHGCHVGCNVAASEGIERGIPHKDLPNYCSNHQAPYDCYLWDFENCQVTEQISNCCRRITFVISGGALSPDYAGRVVDQAQIIDFAPTIAEVMDIDFPAEGESVIRR